MIPTFVINLDRNPERLRFMRAQFNALGFDFERLAGVDGRCLTPGASQAAPYATLAPGPIGCFESHRAAWQLVVERDLPCAVVLEDDVGVAADFGSLAFEPAFLEATDVIKIDTRKWPILLGAERRSCGVGREISRLIGGELSASGYVITRRGAARALARSRGYVVAVDRFLFHVSSPSFHTRVVWKLAPSMVAQLKYITNEAALATEFYQGIGVELRAAATGDSTGGANSASGAAAGGAAEGGGRVRLRRLADRGRRMVLQRLYTARLPRREAPETVRFSTTDDAHIRDSLALVS
jgi:glycosyl transferase family 25